MGTARIWAWIVAGQAISALGLLFGTWLLTQYLSPDSYGRISLVLGLGALFNAASIAPASQGVLRLYHDYKSSSRLHILRLVTLRVFAISSCVLIGISFVAWMLFGRSLEYSLRALFAAIGLFALEGLRTLDLSYLSAASRQKRLALWGVAEAWLRPALAVLALVMFRMPVESVLFGYAVATLCCLAFSDRPLVLQVASESSSEQMRATRAELIAFAVPLIPVAVTTWLTSVGDRYILTALSSLENAGTYAAVYGLFSRPFQLVATCNELYFRPRLFESITSNDWNARKRISHFMIATAVLGAVTCVIFGLVLGRAVMSWVLAASYGNGAVLIPWILFGCALGSLCVPFELLLKAQKRTSLVLASQLIGAGSSIIATTTMVWKWGMLGAAYSVPIYFFAQLFAVSLFCWSASYRKAS